MNLELAAEQAALGSALLNRNKAAEVAAHLTPDHFTSTERRIVFEAITAAVDHPSYSAPVVAEVLLRAGRLDDVGGASALHDLIAAEHFCPLTHAISVLQGRHRRDRYKAAAQRILRAAEDPAIDPERLSELGLSTLLDAQTGLAPEAGIVTVEQLSPRLHALYDSGQPPQGASTGWVNLDSYYRPRKGRWTLVGGIPSHGKSSWLDALVVNLAVEHGWRFAVCSPESQPLEEHEARLLQLRTGWPFYAGIRGRMDHDLLDKGETWLAEHLTFLLPDEDGRTLEAILALATITHLRRPIDGLVIDPWNELDHSRPTGMTETEHISRTLTRLRGFARQHNVHVWLVAHPTKLQKGTDGNYPVPTPYDVSGSAHWRNKADNALAVWRDPTGRDPNLVEVHTQKVRFQPHEGTEGVARLRYQSGTGRFTEAAP